MSERHVGGQQDHRRRELLGHCKVSSIAARSSASSTSGGSGQLKAPPSARASAHSPRRRAAASLRAGAVSPAAQARPIRLRMRAQCWSMKGLRNNSKAKSGGTKTLMAVLLVMQHWNSAGGEHE